jgi:BirA family biotin operon repressor/biotin-[acetyl-CoA-carboxylase] ligase
MSLNMPSPLNQTTLAKALGPHSFLKRIEVFETIDSTNSHAKRLLADRSRKPSLIIAEEQTQGRGRFGKTWQTEKGKNLMFSLLVSPKIPRQNFGLLPLLTSLGVVKTVESTTKINVITKWPNDLLINDKKICGILLETVSSHPGWVVIGIGLNVNQTEFPSDLHATSLALETGKQIDRTKLLSSIIHHLEWLYRSQSPDQFRSMLAEWKSRCTMLNKTIQLQSDDGVITGLATGIADDGGLHLLVEGEAKKLYAGDVTVVEAGGS